MCGICGFAGTGTVDDLQNMTNTLVHRGPDDEGLWVDESRAVYFGHRRLSIIDIQGGRQPMVTKDDRLIIVYNGEIYNFKELRVRLQSRGHSFFTDHSDTEVLLHGYSEWGEKLPDKLNGMWAFAILDRKKNEIFLSRDRFGKKPLFYSLQNNTFAFSSELNTLAIHPNIATAFSTRSLKKYFAYGYIPAPNSLYEHVYKLPAGFNLVFDLNRFSFQTQKYWDFIIEPFDNIPENPEDTWGEELRFLIKKSVERRLISDVPIGVFLSGGVDSSSVTAYASKEIQGENLKTFSIGFEEDSFDESEYSNKVASFFKTDHHLEMLSMEKARRLLPEIVSHLDEPMGDSSLLPTYLLCRETVKHVTVALGGDGADELFAGYDPFKALKMAACYNKVVPKILHQGISMAMNFLPVSHNNMSFDFKIKRTLRGLSHPQYLWNSVWLGTLAPDEIEDLFNEPVDIEDIYSEAIEYWEACTQDNLIDQTLQFYTKLYLQDDILVKADRASMMNSLEVRAPFLDIDLVNFVRKIPHQWKYRNGQTKYILKKALEPILPHDILYRPKKGFGAPIGAWFKGGLLEIEIGESISGILPSQVKRMINEHKNNEVDHRAFLWNYWLLSEMLNRWN